MHLPFPSPRLDCLLTLDLCLAGGPYATFAGRDASRGLAKQSFEADMLSPLDQPIDNLSDLTESEWKNLRDWESESSRFARSGRVPFRC